MFERMVCRCRGEYLCLPVRLHLLLTNLSSNSKPETGHAGIFHTYRCKRCLTQAALPAVLFVSEVLACQDPSFLCQKTSWNLTSVHYSIYSFSPALTFPPVSEHFFLPCFFSFFHQSCMMKMHSSRVKFRGDEF